MVKIPVRRVSGGRGRILHCAKPLRQQNSFPPSRAPQSRIVPLDDMLFSASCAKPQPAVFEDLVDDPELLDDVRVRLARGGGMDGGSNPINGNPLQDRGLTIDGEWNLSDEQGEPLTKTFPGTTAAIAATHSIFNFTNTLLFLPFLPLFVRLLKSFFPDREFKETPHLTDLDIRILETPTLAIEQSRREIEKMGDGCLKMLDWLAELMQQEHPDKQLADRLKHREQVLDSVQDEVAEFVTNLLSGNVPHAVADEARLQLRMTDEYESVSDYIANLDKFDRKLRRDGHRFTEEQRAGLYELNRHLAEYLGVINEALRQENRNILTTTEPMFKRIRDEIKRLRRKHLDDLSDGAIPPPVSVAYLAALNAYARVRDHSRNIAEAVSGEK